MSQRYGLTEPTFLAWLKTARRDESHPPDGGNAGRQWTASPAHTVARYCRFDAEPPTEAIWRTTSSIVAPAIPASTRQGVFLLCV